MSYPLAYERSIPMLSYMPKEDEKQSKLAHTESQDIEATATKQCARKIDGGKNFRARCEEHIALVEKIEAGQKQLVYRKSQAGASLVDSLEAQDPIMATADTLIEEAETHVLHLRLRRMEQDCQKRALFHKEEKLMGAEYRDLQYKILDWKSQVSLAAVNALFDDFWQAAKVKTNFQVAIDEVERKIEEEIEPRLKVLEERIADDYWYEVDESHPDLKRLERWRGDHRHNIEVLDNFLTNVKQGVVWTSEKFEELRDELDAPMLLRVSRAALEKKSKKPEGLTVVGEQVLENCCPVCMDEYRELTGVNGCKHLFCFKCIVPWVEAKKKCPKCRKTVAVKDLTRFVVEEFGGKKEIKNGEYEYEEYDLAREIREMKMKQKKSDEEFDGILKRMKGLSL